MVSSSLKSVAPLSFSVALFFLGLFDQNPLVVHFCFIPPRHNLRPPPPLTITISASSYLTLPPHRHHRYHRHRPAHPACRAPLYLYRWAQRSREREDEAGSSVYTRFPPVSAPVRQQWSVESLELNGVSIGSMRKLLFSIARGPFI